MPKSEIPFGPIQLNIHIETPTERLAALEAANEAVADEYCLGPIDDRCNSCSTLYRNAVQARDQLKQSPLRRSITLQFKKKKGESQTDRLGLQTSPKRL